MAGPNQICVVGGRTNDFPAVLSAAENAITLNECVRYDSKSVFEDVAKGGFGVLKADSYMSRDITDLAISHDLESGLVTITTLSPSVLVRRGNQAPMVGAVLPFISDTLEDPMFGMFYALPNMDISHMPMEAFLAKASDMGAGGFVISDDRWIEPRADDFFPMSKIDGMKSLSEINVPYIKELRDKGTLGPNATEADMLRTIGELLIKVADTPKEFDAMLELEFGPVYQYYWMAYTAMRARENYRDRELRRLYNSKMVDRLVIDSPFQTEVISFSDKSVDGIMEANRAYLEGKGVNLAETDRK